MRVTWTVKSMLYIRVPFLFFFYFILFGNSSSMADRTRPVSVEELGSGEDGKMLGTGSPPQVSARLPDHIDQ